MTNIIKKTVIYIAVALLIPFFIVVLMHSFNPISLQKSNNCSKVVYDREGDLLYLTTNSNDTWRIKSNLEQIDPLYLKMVLNYEDRHFYSHFGVDVPALFRATFQYIKNRKIISGGSTITMQLAKLLEPKKRTIGSKIKEIFRAFELEMFYTKKEILQSYLTLAPYGGNVESIGAASWRYFGKLPSSLSASEAALLIALPQAPNANNPIKHPKKAKKARDKILKRSFEAGIISSSIYKQALATHLPKSAYTFARYAPHLCRQILKKADFQKTTIDKRLQTQLEDWAKLRGKNLPKDVTIATLVANNKNGEILAYLGSHYIFSRKTQGYVDMIQATRSPGSTLKPFIYALGFSKHIVAPLTLIEDKETLFGDYKPSNFNNKFNGEVTIAYALKHSLNIPAVKVLQRVGVIDFVELLNSSKYSLKIPKNKASLALALGGLGVNMIQLTSYYMALANDGKMVTLHYLKETNSTQKRFLNPKAAREVNSILQEVTPPKGYIKKGINIAFKTGTSYGFRDFWTIAYTKDYTVALLVAKPNGKPMLKSSGLKSAAMLSFEVMGIVESIYGLKSWGYTTSDYLIQPPKILQYFDTKKDQNIEKFCFVYPKKEARYRSSNCKDVFVKAKVANAKEPIIWYIDGKLLESNLTQTAYRFDIGSHTITAISQTGEIISTNLWVDKPDCIE